MKSLFFIIIVGILFLGCTRNEEVTEEDCKKEGKIFKIENVLNFRTGAYEKRASCI